MKGCWLDMCQGSVIILSIKFLLPPNTFWSLRTFSYCDCPRSSDFLCRLKRFPAVIMIKARWWIYFTEQNWLLSTISMQSHCNENKDISLYLLSTILSESIKSGDVKWNSDMQKYLPSKQENIVMLHLHPHKGRTTLDWMMTIFISINYCQNDFLLFPSCPPTTLLEICQWEQCRSTSVDHINKVSLSV